LGECAVTNPDFARYPFEKFTNAQIGKVARLVAFDIRIKVAMSKRTQLAAFLDEVAKRLDPAA
jgi:hypothetical protein